MIRLHLDIPRATLAALSLSLLAACDVPTSAPIVDSRWIVPAQSTRLTVANLLPAGVSVTSDSSGFAVSVASATVTRALSQDCAACAAANGLTIPKPAFIGSASAGSALPADVSSATLASGTLQVSVVNNYTFDPLRPSASAAAPRGYAVITVASGATVVGKDSIDGAQLALPANGGTLSRSIPLSGLVTGGVPLTMSVTLNSPAGDPVLLDASRTIVVTATPANLKVASANVAVVNRQVSSTTTINLSDIDQTISDKVQSGALLLNIANPFNVSGTLSVRLAPAIGAPIVKSIALVTGSSAPSVSFTRAELLGLLGQSVSLTLSGAVNATGGAVSIAPKQVVLVTTHLDLSVQVGG
jgi:hypothetical protein